MAELLSIYHDPSSRILDVAKAQSADRVYYQLWRNMCFAEWMAAQGGRGTKAYHVSLTRAGTEYDSCDHFRQMVRPEYPERFVHITWEDIYWQIARDDMKLERLQQYLETKTAGLKRTFQIDGLGSPQHCATALICLHPHSSATVCAPSLPQPAVTVGIRKAEAKAAEGLTEAKVERSEDKIYLHKEAVLTSTDIADVRVAAGEHAAVDMTFTAEGKKKLAKVTEEHLGKALAIVVDGKVIAAPIIRAKIADRALISVSTNIEAERIAAGSKKK